ncbi:GTP-binding protein, partial [Anaerosalibacter bizertensis]|nr:GTP-binding protein [Anaerosalibacter bizertensis]
MKVYQTNQIRNVALIGHSGSGKTTLTEAVLFATGVTKRQGKVEDGNTFSDFDKEEISRKVSIGASVIPTEWENIKYNFLDTPGYFDFAGEMYGALEASEAAVILVDASSGVEVGTEKAWKYTDKKGIPKMVFLNKMDKENVNFDKVFDELKEAFGDKLVPLTLPIGQAEDFKGIVDIIDQVAKDYDGKEIDIPEEHKAEIEIIRETLSEKVAETDEELMEKYFDGEAFTDEEIRKGLKLSFENGDLVPLIVGSAEKTIGIDILLEAIKKYVPAPDEIKIVKGYSNEK